MKTIINLIKSIIVVFTLLLIVNQASASATTVIWDGEGGDGLWSNPLNWNGDVLPVSGSEIVIEGDVGEVHLDVDFTVGPGTITLGSNDSYASSWNDTLIIDSGVTLTVEDSSQIEIDVLQSGTLINNGVIQFGSGIVFLRAFSGTITNNVNGIINGGNLSGSGVINNNGTINGARYNGGGEFNNTGIFDNAVIITSDINPSSITNNVNGIINAYVLALRYYEDVFNNYGTLNILYSSSFLSSVSGVLNNEGILEGMGGTVVISCPILVPPGFPFHVGIFRNSGTVINNPVAEECKVWVGDASNGLWSDTANWSGGSLPTSTDNILMDDSFVDTGIHLDVDFTVQGLFAFRRILGSIEKTFYIDPGVTLTNDGVIVNRRQIFNNEGILINNGLFYNRNHTTSVVTFNNNGQLSNTGTFDNGLIPYTQSYSTIIFNNNGLLTNTGTFNNGSAESTFNNNSGATTDNQNVFENYGTIINFCGGIIINVSGVVDTCPPVITTPEYLLVEGDTNGAVVVYEVTATDDVDGAITPVCTPASSSLFPLGETTVECQATDSAGNTTSASFLVTVELAQLPDLVIELFTHQPASPTSEDEDPMTFTVVVKNIGEGDADPSTLNFKIGGETFGQNFSIAALSPGDSYTVVRTEYLTIPRGYINHATADALNEVTETDETNNIAEDRFVVWDTTPPTITDISVIASADGFLPQVTIANFPASVGASTIEVKGLVTDNRRIAIENNVLVEVNGSPVTVASDGAWSANISLRDGPNSINVSARDLAGNVSETTLDVTLDYDLDADGILNNIDAEPGSPSENFADTALGGATYGIITDRGDQVLIVVDDLENGVLISADLAGGALPASVSACDDSAQYTLSPGDEVIVTCGSVTSEVISGPIEITFSSSAWTTASITLEAGNSLSFEPITATFIAPATNLNTIVVNVDGIELFIGPGEIINVPPLVGPITAPLTPVQVGASVGANAIFTDPGDSLSYTAIWNWGDGNTEELSLESPGIVTGTHIYTTPGVYTITLMVMDDDGDEGSSVYEYVVVFDPAGGFVTGGGWIDSPEGAYTADRTLTGKASFGFVSRYKKGADVPTGQTVFRFQTAGLDFHSDSYEWLVVAGMKAMYKGVGTINGEGEFKFMLSAIDGDLQGGDGIDKFRIKIWEEDEFGNEVVIYDNLLGAGDDADPVTELGGGSIVIHKVK